ncbi:MAG TPA: MFS transporter [Candidatus Dormibacteraeota bacterium]|nr:MFS transporter [Candidatus Dormibacteraeota bacterium]
MKEPGEELGAGHDPRDIILPRPPGFRSVLANRDFRLIWFAQIASQLADKFLMFALLILTYSISHASTHGAALFLAYTFPSIFLSPLAGVYADRHDKKRLMFLTNAIRGGLILLIPLSQVTPYFEHVTWHFFVIIFLFAAVGQIFAPAEAASIPFIVGADELMTATSMFTSTVIVTLLVAVPVSTLAVRFLGENSPYWIAAGLFLLAAWLIYLVKSDLHARTHQFNVKDNDLLFELREGISYIAGRPLVRFAVIQLSLTIAVIFSVFVLAPSYMSTVLRLQVTDVYLFLAPAVIGMLGAAFYLGQYGRHFRRSRLLIGGLLSAGVTLMLIAVVPYVLEQLSATWLLVWFPVVFGFIGGVEFGMLFIPAFTVLQEKTEAELRGRIFGAMFTVVNAAIAIPILLAGGLADLFGVTRVIFGMGALLVASGAISALAGRRSPLVPPTLSTNGKARV